MGRSRPHGRPEAPLALTLDDLIRRSTDLLKRAADMRSYL
jgi:hypothetical protein